MQVSREMLHPDLRPSYNRLRFLRAVFHNRFAAAAFNGAANHFAKLQRSYPLRIEERLVASRDESHQIRTLLCRPLRQNKTLPLLAYFHGGGYAYGVPDSSLHIVTNFLQQRPCVVVAPDYRKAYRHPFPAGFNDCYDSILWALEQADTLGIDSSKVVIAGHSAGGGLAAAIAIRARDTGDFAVRFQMPIYPMLDYRQPNDANRYMESPGWDSFLNARCWKAYLRQLETQQREIPCYASPALNTDYREFPPTLTFIGAIDPFLMETRQYVAQLRQHQIPVIFKEFPGCYHGFEQFDPKADISIKARDFLLESYGLFYDRYCH